MKTGYLITLLFSVWLGSKAFAQNVDIITVVYVGTMQDDIEFSTIIKDK